MLKIQIQVGAAGHCCHITSDANAIIDLIKVGISTRFCIFLSTGMCNSEVHLIRITQYCWVTPWQNPPGHFALREMTPSHLPLG